MLKTLAIGVAALIAAVLLFASTRPDSIRVQRETSIKAPPEKIFPFIADFHRWVAWSPYEKKDPALKRTYGGAAQGQGAVYAWEGNHEIGQGRMEITKVSSPSKIAIQLDFVKPFEARNVVEFTLQPQGDATHVTWVMQGESAYVAKLMGLFFDMDKMIGQDFEAGLASLKTVAEQ